MHSSGVLLSRPQGTQQPTRPSLNVGVPIPELEWRDGLLVLCQVILSCSRDPLSASWSIPLLQKKTRKDIQVLGLCAQHVPRSSLGLGTAWTSRALTHLGHHPQPWTLCREQGSLDISCVTLTIFFLLQHFSDSIHWKRIGTIFTRMWCGELV